MSDRGSNGVSLRKIRPKRVDLVHKVSQIAENSLRRTSIYTCDLRVFVVLRPRSTIWICCGLAGQKIVQRQAVQYIDVSRCCGLGICCRLSMFCGLVSKLVLLTLVVRGSL